VRWLQDLKDATDKMRAWMQEYNESRPRQALKELTPLATILVLKA